MRLQSQSRNRRTRGATCGTSICHQLPGQAIKSKHARKHQYKQGAWHAFAAKLLLEWKHQFFITWTHLHAFISTKASPLEPDESLSWRSWTPLHLANGSKFWSTSSRTWSGLMPAHLPKNLLNGPFLGHNYPLTAPMYLAKPMSIHEIL